MELHITARRIVMVLHIAPRRSKLCPSSVWCCLSVIISLPFFTNFLIFLFLSN